MDIAITGIKLKYSSGNNDYGTNHFFHLDEKPLTELIELCKDMRTPVCEYDKKENII